MLLNICTVRADEAAFDRTPQATPLGLVPIARSMKSLMVKSRS
jgi:hypothetical protein